MRWEAGRERGDRAAAVVHAPRQYIGRGEKAIGPGAGGIFYRRAVVPPNRLVITRRLEFGRGNANRPEKIQRIDGGKGPGNLKLLDRLSRLPTIGLDPSAAPPCPCRSAVEHKRTLCMNRRCL